MFDSKSFLIAMAALSAASAAYGVDVKQIDPPLVDGDEGFVPSTASARQGYS